MSHWTTYDTPQLKKYVWELHGKIDVLTEKVKQSKGSNHTTEKERRLLAENQRLKTIIEEMSTKKDYSNDLSFVASITNVPVSNMMRKGRSKGSQKHYIIHARRIYAYLQRQRGKTHMEIANSLGYDDHSIVCNWLTRAYLIDQPTMNQIENFLNNKYNENKTEICNN
jgi:hypothetical protein